VGAASEVTATARLRLPSNRLVMVCAALALAGSLAFLAAPAHATFPGQNGRIAFQSNYDGDYEIYTMNPNGTDVRKLTDNTVNDTDPDWSPDGTKIAFTSYDGDSEIFVMNADGSGRQQLTNNAEDPDLMLSADEISPSWSPDGTKIAYSTDRDYCWSCYHQYRPFVWTVHVMNATGGSDSWFSNESTCFDHLDPEWSPDGQSIAYFAEFWAGDADDDFPQCAGTYSVNSSHIALQSPPGGGASLEWTSFYSSQFDWAPSGQTIVFPGYDTGSAGLDVWEAQMPNGAPVRLINTPEVEFDVVASPDNTKFATTVSYATPGCHLQQQCNSEIYTVNRDGSGMRRLTDSPLVTDEEPDWQPSPTAAPSGARTDGYPRPKAATPTTIRFVPAFKQCTSPDGTHGAPLAVPSCGSAGLSSNYLTVGTQDANGVAPNFTGRLMLKSVCMPNCSTPQQEDVSISANFTDVRNADLSDYGGELEARLTLRMTDRKNGVTGNDPATVTDAPLSIAIPCSTNGTASIGSTCAATTTAEAVTPGIVPEAKRSLWELAQAKIYDGGADGVAASADNTLFAVQGVFAP
jgi:Tol biopolymer transport system component